MSNQIVKALEHGAQKLGKTLAEDAGKALKNFYRKAGDNLKKVAHNTREIEAKHTKDLKKILEGHDTKVPHPKHGSGGRGRGGSHPKGRGRDQVKSPRTEGRPQDTRCGGGEPVDMATGRMYIDQVDASFPGSLPLEFTRSFDSGLLTGRWMGTKWLCPFDERLELDADGVVHVRPDRITQSYPHPEPGDPVHASAGSRHELDIRDGLFTITDPATGLVKTFTPDGDEALLTEVRDRHGRHYTLAYDEDGVPLSITHSGGYKLLVTVDNDRITALRLANATDTGGDALLMRYSYTDGHLSAVYNSSGRPMRFANDAQGRILSWTDRNDSQYRYTYDPHDRVTDEGGTTGALRFTFTYGTPDPATGLRTHTETNALGHTTTYTVNDHAQITAVTDPLGAVTRYERDDHDRLLTETDPLGRTTRYAYDGAGDLVRVTRPDGECITAEYTDRLSLLVRLSEPGGAVWQQAFDSSGLRTSLTDPLGAIVRYTYDGSGHLASVTDAFGHTTSIRCSPAGLPVEVTGPTGASTRYAYDAFGHLVSVVDAAGTTTALSWTSEGRPAARTAADGSSESWTYDGEGNLLTHTDPLGGTTSFEYTHFETLAARTTPDGARYTFVHDSAMRLIAVTDPLGSSWEYEHDAAGRVVAERDFQGRRVDYRLDAAGQVVSRTDALGQAVEYSYDVLGNLLSKQAGGATSHYAYDAAGHLIGANCPDAEIVRTVDLLGNVLSETVNGRTLLHRRDVRGRRTHRTTPTGQSSQWSYDAAGRPAALTTPDATLAFSYDEVGRETSRSLGGRLVLSNAWSLQNRLTESTLESVTDGIRTVLQQRAYRYRADGGLIGTDDRLVGPRSFELDRLGRVTAVRSDSWNESYVYDPLGNITEAHWPATPVTEAALGERVYNGTCLTAAGRIRYEYDAAGRTTLRQVSRLSRKPDTWRYTWDAEGRLSAVTTPDGTRWRYLYDPFGRRIAKHRLAADGDTVVEQTDFTWDGAVLVEQTTRAPYLPGPHTLTWEHRDLHPLSQTETITDQGRVDRRFFAIVTDLVGTPVELVDPASNTIAWRATSTLWGATTWPSDSTTYTPLRFPGQYFDPESRLHYNTLRYYDPETARFVSPDPLGLEPAPNPDAYIHNPHQWSDPLGLSPHPRRGHSSQPAFLGDPYHPDAVDRRIRDWREHYGVPQPTMVGENGTQTISKTMWLEGQYRIDVENPDPGGRPGQMHVQDEADKKAKYQYNFETGRFDGLPRSLEKRLGANRGFLNGIKKGLKLLGE